MEVKEISNQDAINGMVFILLKYILEVSLGYAASKPDVDAECREMIQKAADHPIDADMISTVLMGYFMADEKALQSHLSGALNILKAQVEAFTESVGRK